MINKFNEQIADIINIRINKLLNSEESPQYLKEIVRKNKILPLILDMGGCYGISLDGEIISFDWDFDWNNENELKIEKDQRLINLAIYQGSKNYTELKALIPI